MKVTSFLVILLQFTLLLNSTVVVAQYARSSAVEKCNTQGWNGTAWKTCNDFKGHGTNVQSSIWQSWQSILQKYRNYVECTSVRTDILESNDKPNLKTLTLVKYCY